ncbi:MAG: ATP phosphoribosyltransferase [Candidatus Marinimicrobia bacterium]|nr:ATP phosphoribosyltransferase [Candidatus Neomarinimicrobiota bacterium]|tara:strand:- start:497 stop:1123 length:627 start_codon:yes stop_codon:yes gene_type:complete
MEGNQESLILALPKGRVYEEVLPIIKGSQIELKDDPKNTRKLVLDTKNDNVKILLVRGWDVPAYVTSGAAHIGVVGKDILIEKESEEFIELKDLEIGKCRLSLAGKKDVLIGSTRMKVATKYPKSSIKFMESIGIQAEIIYLHGAQEIAPLLGLSDAIIDLVESGQTLKENGLHEIQVIRDISTRLIVNKAALKTKSALIQELIGVFN